MDESIIERVVRRSTEIVDQERFADLRPTSLQVLRGLLDCLAVSAETIDFSAEPKRPVGDLVKIIVPGSRGLCLVHGNDEFEVESIFYAPSGPHYRGSYVGQPQRAGSVHNSAVTTIVPVDQVVEIPGESRVGYFDPLTAEIMSAVHASR